MQKCDCVWFGRRQPIHRIMLLKRDIDFSCKKVCDESSVVNREKGAAWLRNGNSFWVSASTHPFFIFVFVLLPVSPPVYRRDMLSREGINPLLCQMVILVSLPSRLMPDDSRLKSCLPQPPLLVGFGAHFQFECFTIH